MAWNRSTEGAKSGVGRSKRSGGRFAKGVIAGAIVALGAAVAVWWLWPTGEGAGETPPPQTRQRIKEVTPAAAPTNRVEVAKPKPKDSHEGMVRASNGVWHPKGRPYRFNWTAPHRVVTNDTFVKNAGFSAAKTGTEQILESIFSRERGDMPLPLPPNLPEREVENMANIIISRDTITDKDCEELQMSKDLLNQVKDVLQKHIKDGGTVEDFIVDYHEELERCYFKRADAEAYLGELVEKEEDPEVIGEMTKKLNEKLEKEGIKPVANPIEVMENTRIQNEQNNNN